jgi:polar amino acid transport system permease protein
VTKRQRTRVVRGTLYLVFFAVVAAVAVATDWTQIQRAFFDPGIARDMFPRVATIAARNTLIFTAFGFSMGLIGGLALALMRLSTVVPFRWFAAVYIEIFRGLPALLTIFLVGFGLPLALGFRIPGAYGPGSVGLAIVAAAYMAEVIRAGIQAVPRGQMEAARSLGMSYPWAMTSIVIPQAFRIIIPPMTNELVLLLKDTSLLFILGVTDQTRELMKFGRDIVLSTFNATPIVVVGLVYLAITIPMTRIVALLERRAARAR